MASSTLQLFPPPSPPPANIKPCLKQPTVRATAQEMSPARRPSKKALNAEALKGVGLHVMPGSSRAIVVEPASSHIKHSLFCDPAQAKTSHTPSSVVQEPRLYRSTSKRGKARDSIAPQSASHTAPTPTPTPASPRSATLPTMSPHSGSTENRSSFSESTTLVRSNSGATAHSLGSPQQHSMRSMFPQYDPSLPLSRQPYYPAEAPTASLPRQQVSKGPCSPAGRPSPSAATTSHALPVIAEQSYTSDYTELKALWSASNGEKQNHPHRKVRLAMRRAVPQSPSPKQKATAEQICFGSSSGIDFYTFDASVLQQTENDTHETLIRRHHPTEPMAVPVAQLQLAAPSSDSPVGKEESTPTQNHLISSIFPQLAALAALESAANTREASSIAQYDPRASSPQAAQLAFDAVTAAQANEKADLMYIPTGPDAFGRQKGTHSLHHPRLGTFSITVEGRTNLVGSSPASHRSSRSYTSGKISLHHPYASAAKSTGQPPVLVSLDLKAEILEIDVAALQELDSPYIIDTAVCTVFAVALDESRRAAVAASMDTFAPPPLSPVTLKLPKSPKQQARSPKRRDWLHLHAVGKSDGDGKSQSQGQGRNGKERKRSSGKGKGNGSETVQLPALTRGILHLLGFAFDSIVWMLGLGVKVLAKLVVGLSGVVSKA